MKLHPAFLDIFSILLSFYILVCVLIIQNINEFVEARLPEINLQKINHKNNHDDSKKKKSVSISIKNTDKGLEYFVNDRQVEKDGIAKSLMEYKPQDVIIRADRNTPHGVVVDIMAKCQKFRRLKCKYRVFF